MILPCVYGKVCKGALCLMAIGVPARALCEAAKPATPPPPKKAAAPKPPVR